MIQTTSTQHWYLRVQGKVRGPFALDRICSMRERGRLGPNDELSHNRRDWVLAGSVADVFPDGFASEEPLTASEADWFYLKDGQRQGPIRMDVLQSLANSGQLSPQDSVWKRGMAAWSFAGQVPEIVFPPVKQNWWGRQGTAVKISVLAGAIILAIFPLALLVAFDQFESMQANIENLQAQITEAEQREDEDDQPVVVVVQPDPAPSPVDP